MSNTDIVEQIKAKIDIVTLTSEYLELRKSGRNYKGLCPFHGEKTPSFYVSPERGTWHCFGCHEGGDVITFLQKWENIEFIEALKILADKVGVTLSGFTPTESFSQKEKIIAINHLASEFYHYLLMTHPVGKNALEYLKSRHIKPETMKTFALGYSPNSWDNLKKFLNKKGYDNEDLVTAGLVIRSERGTYYDRFRGRVMFALRDSRGNTIGFSGRVLPGSDEKSAKYINSPETPVYIKGHTLYGLDISKEAIKKEKYAVVVEGEVDLIASFQSGITNVVAIKGSAFTAEQVVLLKRYTGSVCYLF
jgi:DNA primase